MQVYLRMLDKRPLATKSFTSGFLFSLGDVLTQVLFDRPAKKGTWKFESQRSVNMFIVGSMFAGPVLHRWYGFVLPRLVNAQPNPTRAQFVFNTGKGILLDQTIFATFFLTNFIFLNDALSGKSFQESADNLKELIMPTMLTNWKIWPFLQAINQTVMPMQFRVLFVNFCGLFWNMYLSFVVYSAN